jgi:hypothetical protein
MDVTTRNGGFHVVNTTGDVGPDGDLVGRARETARGIGARADAVIARRRRLRAVCPNVAANVDLDEHLTGVVRLIEAQGRAVRSGTPLRAGFFDGEGGR